MSTILMRKQSALMGACRVASRPGTMSRPGKPFTPARHVVVRAAAPEDDDDDMDTLMEGEDFVAGELLDNLVLDDLEDVYVLDDADRAAIAAAEEFSSTYTDELLAEVDFEGDTNSSKEQIIAKAALALDEALTLGTSADSVLSLAGEDSSEAEGVEDMQGPGGFRKYDEEEQSGLSLEQREQVEAYKLTKTELSNLVPEDWDTINVDWFTSRKEENIPLPEYKLNFIWTERNIAVSVDQVYSRGQISPLTEYFFWPRKDAWEDLRVALEARPWISERDKVILLNRTTEVINFWQQEGEKPTLEQVRAAFLDCSFMGTATPPAPEPAPAAFEAEAVPV